MEGFSESLEKSWELLCKMRQVATLVDVRNFVATKRGEMEYSNISEYDYCKLQGKLEILNELESLINEKIIKINSK